jgi:hypothetical protein
VQDATPAPSLALMSEGKLAGKDRNENDIVDPEHDLEGSQRDERDRAGSSG